MTVVIGCIALRKSIVGFIIERSRPASCCGSEAPSLGFLRNYPYDPNNPFVYSRSGSYAQSIFR